MFQQVTQTEMVVYLAIATSFIAGAFIVGWQIGRVKKEINESKRHVHALRVEYQHRTNEQYVMLESLFKDIAHLQRKRNSKGRFEKEQP